VRRNAGKIVSDTKGPTSFTSLRDDLGYGDLSCFGAKENFQTPNIE